MLPESVQRAPKTGGRWQVTGVYSTPHGSRRTQWEPSTVLGTKRRPLPLGCLFKLPGCLWEISTATSAAVLNTSSPSTTVPWSCVQRQAFPPIHTASHAAHFGDGVFVHSCRWQSGQPWEQPAGSWVLSEWTYTPPIRSTSYFHSMRSRKSQKRAAMTTAKMKWSEKTGYTEGSHSGYA